MDFIVELLPSQGYDTIFVCIDRFTKMAHFCPTNTTITVEGTADLYLRHVFKYHGLLTDIVYDRGPQFISRFTCALLESCDIKGNRSIAFHPESDWQMEPVNQTLEQYLQIYCDYHQDDWSQLLPLAEFVYNNAKSTSTGTSPFYANYGRHPRHTIRIWQPTTTANLSRDDVGLGLVTYISSSEIGITAVLPVIFIRCHVAVVETTTFGLRRLFPFGGGI